MYFLCMSNKEGSRHVWVNQCLPLLVFKLNPLVMNGLAYHYHLGELIVILRGIRRHSEFLFHFSMKFL